LTYPECDLHCAKDLRRVIELEDASTVAAVLMDQSSLGSGFQAPPPGYMKTIREICDDYDILLIIDEVLTGMGKTGTWFECLQHDFTPDMMCLAKTLAGSHLPLSACHIREKIAEPLMTDPRGGQLFSYSFMGFPPCCAAAIANIKVIEENNVLDGVVKKSAFALSELKEIKERFSIVGDVQATGLGLGIRLVKNPENKEKFTPDEVARVAEIVFGYTVEHGVVLYPEEVQWEFFIFMFPALTIAEEDLKFGLDTAAGAIRQVQNEFRLG
jgi:adenosylmethionine-8-amino-7-oxononanoate aminotransferase